MSSSKTPPSNPTPATVIPASNEVIIVRPDFALKKKIGKDVKLDSIFTEEKIAASKKIVEESSRDLIRDVHDMLDRAQGALEEEKITKEGLFQLFDCIFAIKSTAGIAGYPLATEIAKQLYLYIEMHGVIEQDERRVMLEHLNALRAIFRNELKGDGGPIGAELLQALAQLRQKYP
jgi:hypothetical protein